MTGSVGDGDEGSIATPFSSAERAAAPGTVIAAAPAASPADALMNERRVRPPSSVFLSAISAPLCDSVASAHTSEHNAMDKCLGVAPAPPATTGSLSEAL